MYSKQIGFGFPLSLDVCLPRCVGLLVIFAGPFSLFPFLGWDGCQEVMTHL
jgi:hypothetical protein